VKAANFFEKEKDKTQEIYEKLADCYYYNSEMDKAVKWYSYLMVEHKRTTSPEYYFKYAQALKGIKEYVEANFWLNEYQKKIKSDKNFKANKLEKFLDKAIGVKTIYTVTSLDSNTDDTDFGGAFYNDKLIFSSSRTKGTEFDWNNKPYLDLYQADIDALGNLNNIELFSDEINTRLHESNAVFTKNGKRMFFTRNNYLNGKQTTDAKKVTHLKIYSADLVDNKWGNIKELPFNGNSYSVIHPALSDDDKKLYFSSDMPGTIGSFDLFVVRIIGEDSYSKPTNLGTKINTEHLEQFPFYSNDTLYFSSNGLTGFGSLDIFKSYKSKQGFTSSENLQLGINSNLDDFGYVIDEKTSMGYISSNRNNGKGSDDIYRFKKAKNILQIQGFVKEKSNEDFINNATLTLFSAQDSILESVKTDKEGSFLFNLKRNTEYTIKVAHELYESAVYTFKTKDNYKKIDKIFLLELYQNIEESFVLLEIDSPAYYESIEESIVLKNDKIQIDHEPIYFDLNSSYLTPKAELILDEVVRIINKYPKIKIHCASHTDSRANNKYNNWLSIRRAQKTADYLLSKGINANRITKDGYGETQLINRCLDNIKCSEEEHQLNRRTEFILE
jgi:outer membrane protein OmpA-like peptidoglycan-associated protein